MGGRPSYPEREYRKLFKAHLRHNRPLFVKIVAVEVAAVAVITIAVLTISPWAWMTGYLLGATHVAFLAMIVHFVRLGFLAKHPAAVRHMQGSLGESNTSEALKKAKRKGLVWGCVEGISVDGGDIDHLVVTRNGGVVAIDTKWMSDDRFVAKAASSAMTVKRRAELVLRSTQVLKRDTSARHRDDRLAFEVRPLVVVWGAAGEKMPDEAWHGEVQFVAGEKLLAWLEALDGDPIDRATGEDLLATLRAFNDRVVTTS